MKANIRTVSGHLTATNKNHIRALLLLAGPDAKQISGKANRISYHLTTDGETWSALITFNERHAIGANPKPTTYKATFTTSA